MQFAGELYRQLRFFLSFFGITACVYATLRTVINRKLTLKQTPINIVISVALLIIAALITMVMYVLLLPLILYKILITFMLTVIHREHFGGLLKGGDVVWFYDSAKSNNTGNCLLIIQFSKNGPDLLEYVREVVAKLFLCSTRLTCTRQNFMGYQFLLKNQLSVDDVVRVIDGPQTLSKIVQDNCNKPLPKNNTAAWELLVGTQPIDSDDQYPLLIRAHHSISDGITFLSLLAKQISDEKNFVMNVPKYEGAKIWERIKKFFQLHTRMVFFRNPAGINELRNPNLSARKKIGFYVERDRKYVRMIKQIKKRVEGASFSSVILTAMSESLEEYFKRKAERPPEDLILSFVAIADLNDLHFDHPDLANVFSMGNMKLPIALDGSKTAFERLLEVARRYAEIIQSHDIFMYQYFIQVFLDLLPVPALLYILKMMSEQRMLSTIALSSLPGIPKIHIGGNALTHMLCFAPNYLTIGVEFTLVTYDGRLQMSLMVDEVLIPEEGDVQEILDDIFKHIDLLYNEIVLN